MITSSDRLNEVTANLNDLHMENARVSQELTSTQLELAKFRDQAESDKVCL